MFDYKRVYEDIPLFEREMKKRGFDGTFDSFKVDYEKRLLLIKEVEELKALRNKVSKEIPLMMKKGEDVSSIKQEMRDLSNRINEMDKSQSEINEKINSFISYLPNIADSDVPEGGKENNKVIHTYGQERSFTFKPKDHYELLTELNIVDFERGVKLGGNGSWVYKGLGAHLEWALLNYFVKFHTKNNYQFILPPHILTYENGYTAGQFPKFSDEVYYVKNKTDDNDNNPKFILPTSETALVNLYRDEIISKEDLPIKLFAYSPCYRVEAGSYRTAERGTIRGHQFNKVEMFQLTTPEDSENALQEMLSNAQKLVEGLGLTYRTTLLAALDASASMAKTFDVEVYLPSMGYKEVSSISNSKSYQSRRGNIRYRSKEMKKTDFIHTLNGSGLATSRLIPAICEQYQQEDGSIEVPQVLQKWMNCKFIRK